MQKINIWITEETFKALCEKSKKENKRFNNVVQEILAKETKTKMILWEK